MLEIVIPDRELYDDKKQEFLTIKGQVLQLEHSLVSLSKWEAKWELPFLGKGDKSEEQIRDYIRCMTITQNVKPSVYSFMTDDIFAQIREYIDAPMTATWFPEVPGTPKSRRIITAEIIYYWMIAQNVPWECQKWHLNRLLTLLRVCGIENAPKEKSKMSKAEMLAQRRRLNDIRRAQYNTKG